MFVMWLSIAVLILSIVIAVEFSLQAIHGISPMEKMLDQDPVDIDWREFGNNHEDL